MQQQFFYTFTSTTVNRVHLCRLSSVDAHTVYCLETSHGKTTIDIIHDIVLWHFATCTSVNRLNYMCPGRDIKLHPHRVNLYRIGFVGSGLVLAKALT